MDFRKYSNLALGKKKKKVTEKAKAALIQFSNLRNILQVWIYAHISHLTHVGYVYNMNSNNWHIAIIVNSYSKDRHKNVVVNFL